MCFADSYIGALCGMTQADVKALRERYHIVETVSGLLLTIIVSHPSFFRAQTEWTEQ